MNTSVKNLLYDRPELYEALYREINDETPSMCRRVFERYLKGAPASILDIACGTGRDIRSLRRTCDDCVGIDFLPQMVEYAKSRAPDIPFIVGDMRSIRLGRTFDVILCFGSAILYALSKSDLDNTFATFAAHSHPDSLLIVDFLNASALLGDGFKPRLEGDVSTSELTAHWVAEHSLDRRRQRLIRKRTWNMSSGDTAEDYCEYRLLFPLEVERLATAAGFKMLGMFDNMDFEESDFAGSTMYVIAERNAEHNAGVDR